MKACLIVFVILLCGCASDHEWVGKRTATYCLFGMAYQEDGDAKRDFTMQPFEGKAKGAKSTVDTGHDYGN